MRDDGQPYQSPWEAQRLRAYKDFEVMKVVEERIENRRYDAVLLRPDENVLIHIDPATPLDQTKLSPADREEIPIPSYFGLALWPRTRGSTLLKWLEEHRLPFLVDRLHRGDVYRLRVRMEDYVEFVAEHPISAEEWGRFIPDLKHTGYSVRRLLQKPHRTSGGYILVEVLTEDSEISTPPDNN